jgi:hypothetical protein
MRATAFVQLNPFLVLTCMYTKPALLSVMNKKEFPPGVIFFKQLASSMSGTSCTYLVDPTSSDWNKMEGQSLSISFTPIQ